MVSSFQQNIDITREVETEMHKRINLIIEIFFFRDDSTAVGDEVPLKIEHDIIEKLLGIIA